MVADRGIDARTRAGAALALLLVGGVVGRMFWGWVSDRVHGNRLRVLPADLVAGRGRAGAGCAFGWAGCCYVVLPLIGLTSVGWNGVFITAITEAADPARPASAMVSGRSRWSVCLGSVLIPPGFGWVVHALDSRTWPGLVRRLRLSALLLQVSRVGRSTGVPDNVR